MGLGLGLGGLGLGLGLGGGQWVQTFREPPGSRRPAPARRPAPGAAHLASVRIPVSPLWGPERPLWRPEKRLWRPKNEDSSIKIKGFGSNLFNLMELSSFFGRNRVPGGFPGVLGAAGTFSGPKRPFNLEGAGKNPIWPESGSSTAVCRDTLTRDSYGSPGACGMPPGPF